MNVDNLRLFYQPDDAHKWVLRIEKHVGSWITKMNNKSFWYIVHWESMRQGILKENTTRKDFSRLLVQECPHAIAESDTEKSIFHNIEKFPFKNQLRNFDLLQEKSFVREYVQTVSQMLTYDVPTETQPCEYTVEQRMEEYLTTITASEVHTKVCIRPIYNGKTATMSVEKYYSQRLVDEHKPSYKTIFECVDERLTEDLMEKYRGRFCSLSNTKLFLVSTHSFSAQVKKEATDYDIGLVFVDPRKKVDEDCFIFPRTQGNNIPEEILWDNMLTGKEPMTEAILVYDKQRIDNSLSYVMYKYASCNKENLFIAAPILSDDDIESKALQLVKPQIDIYVPLLKKCGPQDNVPSCVIDPYQIAKDIGLIVHRGKTGRYLGQIDISSRNVTLSEKMKADNPRDRFSMAHEIGHSIFHQQLVKKLKDGHHMVSNTKKWIEHHAHYFASCLLMPAPVIRLLFEIYWKKEFHREKICPLYVGGDIYSDRIFQRVVGPISRKMKVSLEAAYIRLKKMGLVCKK